jgi:hypothetical protein
MEADVHWLPAVVQMDSSPTNMTKNGGIAGFQKRRFIPFFEVKTSNPIQPN